jgi:hypothetical protein
MKELTKGTLVMTDMGLAWYDRIENGEHLVNPITWENDHLSPHFNASLATRAQVEEKIKEMGWYINSLGNWVKDERISENPFWAKQLETTPVSYTVKLDGALHSADWDKSPAQLAEAILVARMLNATKD